MSMLAYHSDPAIKRKYLRRVRAHQKADKLLQGYGYWKDGKGCAVGCCVQLNEAPHSRYPIELGIPEELAYLEDSLFEAMTTAKAQRWPERFLSAIKPGADLSRVYDLWCAWMLDDPTDGVIVMAKGYPDVERVVREAADDCRAGKRVNEAKRAEAMRAASAASAAWAARAASAAWAAEAASAASAAWAARTARTARAARAAWAAKQADKLIELLEAA